MSFLSSAAGYLAALKPDGRTGHNFQYSHLEGPTSIRLLRIHPGGPEDIVSCSLRVVDLNHEPVYTALSYTWRKQRTILAAGAAIAKETIVASVKKRKYTPSLPELKPPVELSELIHCDGKDLFVSPALHEILQSFRDKGTSREYWIDGICMNQR